MISKDRHEDAIKVLDRVRPYEDVQSGISRLEVEAISEAVRNDREKGPWIELVVSLDSLDPQKPVYDFLVNSCFFFFDRKE